MTEAKLAAMTLETWPASRVRSTFLSFFEKKAGLEHVIVDSSPVVPLDDPTLLFANSGMNQFKPIFLGQVDPKSPLAKLKRAADTQKCIRAGGKHNDLDDVGKDTYHHTFFEMLGNWRAFSGFFLRLASLTRHRSFGDYFKREAIDAAWELLTQVYGIPEDRLYATYFQGDAALGLPPDEEAKSIWLEKLPPHKVLPFGGKDNFWEMGDTGPCGPCTEIHYDRLGGRDASALVNADDPMCIEIWNNVFMQFNREADGSLRPLPAKHVDTGMGFERLVSILQNKPSNYDTDVFAPLFEAITQATGARPYEGRLGAADVGNVDMAYRVVADHIRTLSFAIADGAQPGAEGRNYVLRRILRRAVRYGRECLGAPEGFFASLVPALQASMGTVFPELLTRGAAISAIIAEEEASFGRTLVKGLEVFTKMAVTAQAAAAAVAAAAAPGGGGTPAKAVIPGCDAFLLWDTFGFPVDLTLLMAEERGMGVDVAGFNSSLEEAKEKSRAAGRKAGDRGLVFEAEATAHLASIGVVPTIDGHKYVWHKDVGAKVLALLTPAGYVESVTPSTPGPIGVVLDATPFYAESGGQACDVGLLASPASPSSPLLHVSSVTVAAGFVLHVGDSAAGDISRGDGVTARVDYARRSKVAPNHTMTHVLNHALRAALGAHVEQRGSLVDADKLRFDFAHPKPVEATQLAAVEAAVRACVASDVGVHSQEVPLGDAKAIAGLRAVFGEVYPDPVRVVCVGTPIPQLLAAPGDAAWTASSIEFCGGTHVSRTGDAAAFALLSEEGVAKGIRRIVAVTGAPAVEAISRGEALLRDIAAAEALPDASLEAALPPLKVAAATVVAPAAVRSTAADKLGELSKRATGAAKAAAAAHRDAAVAAVEEACVAAKASSPAPVHPFVVLRVDVGTDADALRAAALASQSSGVSSALFSSSASKLMVYIAATASAEAAGLDPKAWLAASLAPAGGKGGGGKAGLAQGQAAEPGAGSVDAGIEAARAFATAALGHK